MSDSFMCVTDWLITDSQILTIRVHDKFILLCCLDLYKKKLK